MNKMFSLDCQWAFIFETFFPLNIDFLSPVFFYGGAWYNNEDTLTKNYFNQIHLFFPEIKRKSRSLKQKRLEIFINVKKCCKGRKLEMFRKGSGYRIKKIIGFDQYANIYNTYHKYINKCLCIHIYHIIHNKSSSEVCRDQYARRGSM